MYENNFSEDLLTPPPPMPPPMRPHSGRALTRVHNRKHSGSDYAVKYGSLPTTGGERELPARDVRRAMVTNGELDGSFVTLIDPGDSEPHSAETEEPTADEVDEVINYHNPPSAGMDHPESHQLNTPHNGEAWTWGDPAKVFDRTHRSEQPRDLQ